MKKRILVVDDDPAIVESLDVLLTHHGYEVCTVQRGDKVFENIVTCSPDLILMDVMLSGMDGRTICRALRAIDSTSNIPIILFSGGNYEAGSTLLLSFADDYLAKPFDMERADQQDTAPANGCLGRLPVCDPGMHALYIVADIEHNTGAEVKYDGEAYRQKRGVDKEKAYFINGNVQPLAYIGAYSE